MSCQPIQVQTHKHSAGDEPEIILLDGANSPHFADFISAADNLDSDVCAVLNNSVLVVGPVRRSRVGVPLDITWNRLQLIPSLATAISKVEPSDKAVSLVSSRTCSPTNILRGPAFAKKPVWFREYTRASICQTQPGQQNHPAEPTSIVLSSSSFQGDHTVSPGKGCSTTARYLTVNSASPLLGRMRPSEMSRVSMIETMK